MPRINILKNQGRLGVGHPVMAFSSLNITRRRRMISIAGTRRIDVELTECEDNVVFVRNGTH